MKLYHNPRCSKSREALALLREAGVDVEIVEYLKTPPSRDALLGLISASKSKPREFVRTGDAGFKEAGLKLSDDASAEEVARLLAKHPELLQRPIAVAGKKVVIGRPPEKIRELIG